MYIVVFGFIFKLLSRFELLLPVKFENVESLINFVLRGLLLRLLVLFYLSKSLFFNGVDSLLDSSAVGLGNLRNEVWH
jgi:hypothetical protein